MTTQQLLDILRDVEPGPERAAIVEELGCDVAHVRCSARVPPYADHGEWHPRWGTMPATIVIHNSTPPWVENPPEVSYTTYARLRRR